MELLTTVCKLSDQLSKNAAVHLESYFEKFVSRKRVVRRLEMKDLLSCFALTRKVGDSVLLSSLTDQGEGTSAGMAPDQVVPLLLKTKLSDATLLDLGRL